jgi:MYXO-CTERM domain-containing protein
MLRLRQLLIVAVACACAVAPASAVADGDPASDVLLGQDVFYPYSPAVSRPIAKTLDAMTAASTSAHFPIKVALIASPVDLGVVPDLFGKPQRYADFLVQEISFQAKQHLLVVMPAGYGVQGFNAAASSALATVAKPAGGSTDDLARAAIVAVSKLAKAAGHPVTGVDGAPGASGGSGGGSSGVIVGVLVAVALAALAGLVVLRRRRAPA